MKKHSQSGCDWYEGEVKYIQLQHDHTYNKWFLIGHRDDNTIVKSRISLAAAQILLANGIAFGD